VNERRKDVSAPAPTVRPIAEIHREIEQHFGFFPAVFEPARAHPVVLDLLWRQLWVAVIQNPIPERFKARLHVERLRHVAAPGVLAWHSCALLDTGIEPNELLTVLEQPPPASGDALGKVVEQLAKIPGPLTQWPKPGGPVENQLLAAATATLTGGPSPQLQLALQRLLGPQLFAQWSVLIMHIHAYANWVHMHPEIARVPDPAVAPYISQVIREHPALANWLTPAPDDTLSARGQARPQFRLTDTTPTGVVQFAIDGTIVFANSEAQRILAMNPDELSRIGASDLEGMSVWEPGLGEPPDHPVALCLRTLDTQPSVCIGFRRAGEIVWVTLTVLPLRDPTSGEATGVMATMIDSSDSMRVQRRLADTEQLYEKLLATADSGVIVLDREGTVLRANDMAYALFRSKDGQTTRPDLVGKRLTEILPDPETAAVHLGRVSQVMRSGETVEFEDMFEIDGKNRWFSFHAQPLRHLGFVYGVQIVARDVTSKREAEQALRDREERARHEALHDRLTRLPNRVLFLDRLAVEVIHAKQNPGYVFAVLVLDLDRFKNVNDSLGHSAGDRLLIEYSHRLRTCLGPEDTLARMGGDEFAILLKGVQDISDAIKSANHVLELLGQPFALGSHDVYTPTSIGIAISQTGYNRPEDILRDADTAMYRAKSHGKGRYEVFDKAMHAEAVAMLTLESDLRRAIERDEFQLYYQPVVYLATGEIYGFEALVRWVHPLRGLVSPIDFIPLAEETGLILPIGEWVLREACRQMQRWHQNFVTDAPLTISVNLSGKQFSRPALIRRVLRETALEPSSLKLEITESVIMDDPEAASAMLRDLLGDQIQSHVDDFGTGYSSLSYLHTFPTAALKIDRSFVSQIGPGGENSEIVRTIISLAHNLSMAVIAEGVETLGQLELIKQMGCEYGQGYYFSRPVSAADAEALMLRGSPEVPPIRSVTGMRANLLRK